MTALAYGPPAPTEHVPYYGKYVALVTEPDALQALERSFDDAMKVFRSVPDARAEHRYAPGKWSIKEVVGHLLDAERVFAYRALRFARADETELPGFDENTYVPAGAFDRRALAELLAEWELIRKANLAMFRALPAEAWTRQGSANGSPISVRALAYIIAGHCRHHAQVVRERYLS
jgi:hypothetical protein